VALWNWIFRAGLAIAVLGLVWTLWPEPGERAYASPYHLNRSRYHLGPRVDIDLEHWNNSPGDYRFLALGDLLVWDGYRVTRSKQYLVPEYLKDIRVLVIGNAVPYPAVLRGIAERLGLAGGGALTLEEVDAVRDWVRAGGSLLLEADVPRSGRAAAPLTAALGLAVHDCLAPVFVPAAQPGKHAILNGRADYGERVYRAAVLAGGWIEAGPAVRATPLLTAPADAGGRCSAGKAVAMAVELGRGRVVALSAQLERNEDLIRRTGVDPRRSGNRQFLLNAMHWLSHGEN